MRSALMILGMRDNACRERILAALERIEGVCDVQLSLHRGIATIDHDGRCELDQLVAAVAAAGYGAVPEFS